MNVICGIALWYQCTVIRHGNACQMIREVIAMRQETIACNSIALGHHRTAVTCYIDHSSRKLCYLSLFKWGDTQHARTCHSSRRHGKTSTTNGKRIAVAVGEVLAYRSALKVSKLFVDCFFLIAFLGYQRIVGASILCIWYPLGRVCSACACRSLYPIPFYGVCIVTLSLIAAYNGYRQ